MRSIGAGSDLRLMPYVTPGLVHVGDRLQVTALVLEGGLPLAEAQVTVQAMSPDGSTRSLKLLDDGKHGDGAAGDGEYAGSYAETHAAGTYEFVFRAVGTSREGKPFVREAHQDKAVVRRRKTQSAGAGGSEDFTKCCDELLKAIGEQTKILQALLKAQRR